MSDLAKKPLSYFLQEQRETNLKQNDLIIAQQQLLDLLSQLLMENGLGEILESDGVSKLVGKAKAPGISSTLRTFGPTSVPVIWTAGIDDPIPVLSRGVITSARIISDEEANLWNRTLDLNARIRKYQSEIDTDENDRAGFLEGLQKFEDGLVTDAEEEKELRRWTKQNEERCQFLQAKINGCQAEVKDLNQKLSREALHFLLKSSLRKKEDPSPWIEEIYQNLKGQFAEGIDPPFIRELEDERIF